VTTRVPEINAAATSRVNSFTTFPSAKNEKGADQMPPNEAQKRIPSKITASYAIILRIATIATDAMNFRALCSRFFCLTRLLASKSGHCHGTTAWWAESATCLESSRDRFGVFISPVDRASSDACSRIATAFRRWFMSAYVFATSLSMASALDSEPARNTRDSALANPNAQT
jgi:hypothetical protein